MILIILVKLLIKLLKWKSIYIYISYYIIIVSDPQFHLNYAIVLYNHKEVDKAKQHFGEFLQLYEYLDEERKKSDPDVIIQMNNLKTLLSM